MGKRSIFASRKRSSFLSMRRPSCQLHSSQLRIPNIHTLSVNCLKGKRYSAFGAPSHALNHSQAQRGRTEPAKPKAREQIQQLSFNGKLPCLPMTSISSFRTFTSALYTQAGSVASVPRFGEQGEKNERARNSV